MSEKRDYSAQAADAKERKDLYRRWLYMAIALIAVAIMPMKPVFSFQDDKGIIYVRSFSMTEKVFVVTQRELDTGLAHISGSMSVRGLFFCRLGMLLGCIACMLCFFNDEWRVWICTATALLAGLYYVLLVHYAIKISDKFYATLFPTIVAVLPAIVLQMMLLVRRNVLRSLINEEDE